ncbi:MAG: hypothetical protein JNK15_06050 [Planctomycetes bacterium]|nr:hypothetical protein [Planctomycetota bacterium]
MQSDPSPTPKDPPPPFGSWARTYAASLVLAVAVIALLWLLTAFGNVPLGSAR